MKRENLRVDERRLEKLFYKYKDKISLWNADYGAFDTSLNVYVPLGMVVEYCKILGLNLKKVRADGFWHALNLRDRLLEIPKLGIEEGDGKREDVRKSLEPLVFEVSWIENPSAEDGDTSKVLQVYGEKRLE